MDKVSLLLVVAFVAVASAGSLGHPRHARVPASHPLVSDILTSQNNNDKVPVQPVEESEEQEAVVVADGSGDSEDVVEEVADVAVADEASVCADITGVWQQQDSEAKLVIVQNVESRELRGLFRRDSESGWFELVGFRARHEGGSFAFSMIGDEGNTAASSVGNCHACTGTLELHGVHSVVLPGCQTHAMAYLHKNFAKVGDAAEAHTLVKVVFGDEAQQESEEAEVEEAQEVVADAAAAENKENEQGSGDE